MIQALGLLLCGGAAFGLLRADSFGLLMTCWVMGAVLLAGLVCGGRSRLVAVAAREAFLVEISASWILAVGWLLLAQNADDQPAGSHGLMGAGLLLAVTGRLGLAPLSWWPARVAGAPPAVRVFLLAGLHPATALLLWRRFDLWLEPWHLTLVVWLGSLGALLAIAAAAGERPAARRALWLGIGLWGGLLASLAGSGPGLGLTPDTTAAIGLLAAGLTLMHLQVAMPRWPVFGQRLLLLVGGLTALAALLLGERSAPWDLPAIPRLAAVLLAVWVLWRWLREFGGGQESGRLHESGRPGARLVAVPARRPALAALAPVARLGQSPGPVVAAARAAAGWLARLAADIDRVVLGGVSEGLGWIALGAGWLVAWIDRRGLDGLDRGAGRLFALAGRGTARVASGRPGLVLVWAVLVVLALSLLGWVWT